MVSGSRSDTPNGHGVQEGKLYRIENGFIRGEADDSKARFKKNKSKISTSPGDCCGLQFLP